MAIDINVGAKESTKMCSCVRLDVLQTNELLELCTKWERTCQTANDHIFLLKVALTKVTKSKDYFSVKLESILDEGSLPEIAELFRRASNMGVFDNHLVLLKLLTNIGFNLLSFHKTSGKGNRKHYHPSTIKLFEVLQNFGGSTAHNFLSKNLVEQCLNTTRRVFCKDGLIFSLSINESVYMHIATILKAYKEKAWHFNANSF